MELWRLACPWLKDDVDEWLSRGDFWDCILIKARQVGSLEMLLFLLWYIWWNRNKCLHDMTCSTPMAVFNMALKVHAELTASCRPMERMVRHVVQWQPPPLGVLKINVDASFLQSTGEAGLDVVIRDHNGVVCYSGLTRMNFVSCPLMAEMYAVIFGLRVAVAVG